MGTHPIFESDFDCLTEWAYDEIRRNRHSSPAGMGILGGVDQCNSVDDHLNCSHNQPPPNLQPSHAATPNCSDCVCHSHLCHNIGTCVPISRQCFVLCRRARYSRGFCHLHLSQSTL